jgi:ABC-2 type transport system ATP-binding protein
MIEVRDVTHHYGIRPVLKQINLQIAKGELVVVVGPNGMGKSTLLGVLAGVLAPVHGYVTIDGVRWRQSAGDELALRGRTVYLSDHPWLPAARTGREFLLGVAQVFGVDSDRSMDHVDRLLDLFELANKADSPIRSYSSGQQKKIALCGALVTDASILFLDEPFSGGLDPAGLMALKRVLRRRVKEQGATVIVTSPVPEIVEEIADRIVILKDGEVAAFDTLEGLRRQCGTTGRLGAILEKLLYPETVQRLEEYFGDRVP